METIGDTIPAAFKVFQDVVEKVHSEAAAVPWRDSLWRQYADDVSAAGANFRRFVTAALDNHPDHTAGYTQAQLALRIVPATWRVTDEGKILSPAEIDAAVRASLKG